METTLAAQQRRVKVGVAGGTAAYLAILAGTWALSPMAEIGPVADRLALAARCAVFPAFMLLAGVGAVANGRYASEAINPIACNATPSMLVNQRYLQNTLEQLVLHVVALFAIAADGSAFGIRLLPGLAACFVVGRLAFWLGYRKHPMWRGPGFTITMQPTALALLYVAVRVVLRAVT
jgi:hypothetical protein